MRVYEQSIREAKQLLSIDVAIEIAGAFNDNVVFPMVVEVDRGATDDRLFPGWLDDVLVIATENQEQRRSMPRPLSFSAIGSMRNRARRLGRAFKIFASSVLTFA